MWWWSAGVHGDVDGVDLMDLGASVALLEGDVCGHGPSGRNAGFCESLWMSAEPLRGRLGMARRAHSWTPRAVPWATSEPGAGTRTWTPGSTSPDTSAFPPPPRSTRWGRARWRPPPPSQHPTRGGVDAAGPARLPLPALPAPRAHPRLRQPPPPRLAMGLRRRLIERGAQERESSQSGPAGRGGRWTAEAGQAAPGGGRGACPGPRRAGSELARACRHLHPRVLTEPVPDVLEEIGWTGGECVTDGHTLVHFRTTRDGRIVSAGAAGGPRSAPA